jgi:hypothetical protein
LCLGTIPIPVCRPDAINLPAEVLQDLLTKPIALAGYTRRVVGNSVTFDAKDVSPSVLWVDDCEINPKACSAHLTVHLIVVVAEEAIDAVFER